MLLLLATIRFVRSSAFVISDNICTTDTTEYVNSYFNSLIILSTPRLDLFLIRHWYIDSMKYSNCYVSLSERYFCLTLFDQSNKMSEEPCPFAYFIWSQSQECGYCSTLLAKSVEASLLQYFQYSFQVNTVWREINIEKYLWYIERVF